MLFIISLLLYWWLLIFSVAKKVDVTHTLFDSSIADIQWLTKNASTVIVLTSGGRVWRSLDAGRNFEDMSFRLTRTPLSDDNVTLPIFDTLSVHPDNSDYGVLISKKETHYFTVDGGRNWNKLSVNLRIFNWVWHPFRPTYALFSRWTDGCSSIVKAKHPEVSECNHVLYVTKDLGQTYNRVTNYVVQYSWGPKINSSSADVIFFTSHTTVKSTGQPRHSGWHDTVDFLMTYNQGASYRVILKGGNKFLVARDYIFCAQVEDTVRQTVNLMVSTDGGLKFTKAKIPTTLKDKSYTILDTTQGGVVIHVNHGSHQFNNLEGNVYVSDETGTRFALSLPNNIRSATGECEFDRVMGVEGVYIANFRDSLEATSVSDMDDDVGDANDGEAEGLGDALSRRHSAKTSKKSTPVLRTVISFDKGGYWNYLKPPTVDSLGKPIVCEDPTRCFLHLHGITHFDRFAPFYSIENALGLVLGTGNVGTHLSRNPSDINTYISRDAGLTWKEAHKGAFIYEYGDHGGLVVMASDNAATDQVVFSWNEGHSWYDFKLGLDNVQVDNVIIEPSSGGLEFLLYGMANDRGVVFHMDFAALQMPPCMGLDKPDAVASDYETWIPSDGSTRECLLGRTVKYTRKRVTSECFNGRDFIRSKDKNPCQCTERDFECEVGFFRQVGGGRLGECQPSPYADRDYMDVSGCTSSGTYMTAAYRKVPGDQCVNGFSPSKVSVPCPPGSPLAHTARATLLILCCAVVCVAAISWASKHPVLRKYIHNAGFDNFMEVGYSVVGRATETVQKGGEEIFNFWNPATAQPDTQFGVVTLGNLPQQSTVQAEMLAAGQGRTQNPFYETDSTPVQSRNDPTTEPQQFGMSRPAPTWDTLI